MSSADRLVRIGIARDRAFCFYYQHNFDLLTAAGAEITSFSPLQDATPPDVGGLYLGGGYPELHAAALAANRSMRQALRSIAFAGGALYAECGGMMDLTDGIRDFEGRTHEMVGDARGTDRGDDGLLIGNTLALYTHLHFGSRPDIASAFIDALRRHFQRS